MGALRSELESFQTSSDTEVLINVLAHWGKAGLRKLRGMYAFALWDSLYRYGLPEILTASNRLYV